MLSSAKDIRADESHVWRRSGFTYDGSLLGKSAMGMKAVT